MNTIRLIFASNNKHKAEEMLSIMGEGFSVITMGEAGINIDIPEPYNTIEENASIKARTVYELTQQNCFGDDTGLEVNALNGEPGVKSARYAGNDRNFEANVDKLLNNLKDKKDKSAKFKTVIALMWNGKEYLFEGITKGKIIETRKGNNGFGYDPVFVPDESDKTFGEMKLEEKNLYSHRRKAIDKMIAFLKEQ